VKVADFDGDGNSDIAGRVSTSGDWWVAKSTGTAFANAKWTRWSASVDWINVATGDFNGDGSMDLVGQVTHNGSWYVATSTGYRIHQRQVGPVVICRGLGGRQHRRFQR
jgi:hypothetical protein